MAEIGMMHGVGDQLRYPPTEKIAPEDVCEMSTCPRPWLQRVGADRFCDFHAEMIRPHR